MAGRNRFMNVFALGIEALVVVVTIVHIVVTFSNAVVRGISDQGFSWATDV